MTRQETIIYDIKSLKKKLLPNEKAILFGSRARNDAQPNSDWDMLVLLNKKEIEHTDFGHYAYPFVELGWQFGEYISVKLYTKDEWMQRKKTLFFKNIQSEGIEL